MGEYLGSGGVMILDVPHGGLVAGSGTSAMPLVERIPANHPRFAAIS
jgi:hypothetical protein